MPWQALILAAAITLLNGEVVGGAACTEGGCAGSTKDTQGACSTVLSRYKVVYYRNGWWTNSRRKSRAVTEYYFGGYYCCLGYTLSGNKCHNNACGGCGSGAVDSQRACRDTRSVTSTATKAQAYGCGWWRTCYRIVYTAVTRDIAVFSCCQGYRLTGQTCHRITGPATPVTDCGVSMYSDAGDRVAQIVGGIEARVNEFPWQVRVNGPGNTLCGGTVLSSTYVLTAAHCVHRVAINGLRIVAGDHYQGRSDSTEQRRTPSNVYVHPAFDDDTLGNDIAIIRLNAGLSLGPTVHPACLPSRNGNYIGRSVIISGWGITDDSSQSDSLQYTKVTVTPKSTCVNYFGPLHHVICATDGRGDNDRSICFGDSGGPMVLANNGNFQVIGIASFVSGIGCAAGQPFGFTDVSRYIPWITQITGLS